MSKVKYIKVELKDGTKHVILASNEAFYKKKGAKIMEATQKEIEAAFPEERGKVEVKITDTPEYNAVKTELVTVTAQKVTLENELEAEKAKVEALTSEIETLKAEKAKVEAKEVKK